jgi:integrase/recombinase XerD
LLLKEFKEAVDHFFVYLKSEKRLSINTIDSYSNDLKDFSIFLSGKKVLDELILLEFVDFLKDKELNLKSIKRKISVTKNFLIFASKERESWAFKFKIPSFRDSKSAIKVLSSSDFEKIRETLLTYKNKRDVALVELLYSTGCRVSECISIKLPIFDFLKNSKIEIEGKGGRKRFVFLSESAKQALLEYLNELDVKTEGYLWPSRKKHISRQRVFQILKDLAKEAGVDVESVFPHSFRHRLLTDLVKKGADLISVQRIAGHKNIKTTEIYTHMEDYLYEKINKYHMLIN